MFRKASLVVLFLLAPLTATAENIERGRDESWRERPRYQRDDRRDRNRFELTPFVGYRWGGTILASDTGFREDVELADSGALGLNFGIPLGDTNMKLELMVNAQKTDLTTGGGLFEPDVKLAEFDMTYYHAGLQIPFAESYAAQPFFLVSLGIARLEADIPNTTGDSRFSGSAGLGVKVPLNRNLGLRLEGRGYFTALDPDEDNCRRCWDEEANTLYQGEVSLGLVISF